MHTATHAGALAKVVIEQLPDLPVLCLPPKTPLSTKKAHSSWRVGYV